jgi:succinoglycan biosynthesis transport protein ExoP
MNRQADHSASRSVPTGVDVEQASGVSIADIVRAITKSKWLILACTVICLGCAAIYIVVKHPVYEASATVRIDPTRIGSLGLNDLLSVNGQGGGADEGATEVAVLKSDGVALATLNSLSPSDFKAYAGFDKQTMNFQPSEHRLTRAQENLLGAFELDTTVKQVEGTQLVSISFRSRSPELAATIVNHLVSAYFRMNFDSRFNSVAQVTTWLSAQMDELKVRAADAQKRLAAFQEKNNILGTDASNNTTIDRLKLLNERLTEAEGERIVKEAQMRAAATGDPDILASLLPDPNLQALQATQGALAAQYAQMSTKFGPAYPPLQDLKNQMALVKEKIAQDVSVISGHLREQYDASSRAEAMLRQLYTDETGKAYALDRTQADYALLVAEGASSRDLYDKIQVKLEQAGINAGLNAVNTMSVDLARPPLLPVEPKKGLILAFGLVLGLAVGTGSALLRASLVDDVHSRAQLEAATGLFTLASVPHLSPQYAMPGRGKPAESPMNLVTLADPRSQAAEAYRALRNAILLSFGAEPPKTILIASALPGEGRSLIAANFAVVLAQMGRSVLLVDADLQHSALDTIFGVPNTPGLGQELAGDEGTGRIVSPQSQLPTLHLIPAGASIPLPSEALGSDKFRALLETWKEHYDVVVIDCAPLLSVSDSMPLASWADTVILVARFTMTPVKALQRARDLLYRAQANIAGVVMNDVGKNGEDFVSSRKDRV